MAIGSYDIMLSDFFRRINSANRSETYARHNRKTTVLNAANRKYAANHGFEAPRTTIIYPSKVRARQDNHCCRHFREHIG